ncbi:MAG: OmpA family protein [Aeromonas sp.]
MNLTLKPVLIALALASAGVHAAPLNDWYAGVGAGVAFAPGLDGDDSDAATYSVFGGYNFTENFGAELGYLAAGNWDTRGGDFNSKGATLSAIGRLPLNDTFSVFTEGGAYVYHAKSSNGSENGISPMAGLGLTARLSDWFDVQARYRYIVRVGDDVDVKPGRQVANISPLTLELVIHPDRSEPSEAPFPAPVIVPPAPVAPVAEQTFNLSSDVLFAFGKTTLKPAGVQALDALYQQIADVQPKDGRAVVMGYSDRIGSDATNQALSEARAATVANFLISKGLPADAVSIEGKGNSNPITGNKCDAITAKAALIDCLSPDRRVEIRISGVQASK